MATLVNNPFNRINSVSPIVVGQFQFAPGPAATSPTQSNPPVLTGVSALPLQVSFANTSTNPSPVPIFSTAIPTPINVGNVPSQSTVLTSANPAPAGLLGDLETIVANPSQHLLAIAVILLVGWWIWKKF